MDFWIYLLNNNGNQNIDMVKISGPWATWRIIKSLSTCFCFFSGQKVWPQKKNEGQQNHMAVFSSFCLAKQLNRDRFTVSKFSDMTISSFLNRSVSGFLASTVPTRAAVTKNCGWEVAVNWREVVCIRGTSNCRDFSLLDEFPVKRSLS